MHMGTFAFASSSNATLMVINACAASGMTIGHLAPKSAAITSAHVATRQIGHNCLFHKERWRSDGLPGFRRSWKAPNDKLIPIPVKTYPLPTGAMPYTSSNTLIRM